jgi:hypothetical protein
MRASQSKDGAGRGTRRRQVRWIRDAAHSWSMLAAGERAPGAFPRDGIKARLPAQEAVAAVTQSRAA